MSTTTPRSAAVSPAAKPRRNAIQSLAATLPSESLPGVRAAITRPQWDSPNAVNDWRKFVPWPIKSAWPSMSAEARLVAYMTCSASVLERATLELLDKTPPSNATLEREVLCAAIVCRRQELFNALERADFFHPFHAELWGVLWGVRYSHRYWQSEGAMLELLAADGVRQRLAKAAICDESNVAALLLEIVREYTPLADAMEHRFEYYVTTLRGLRHQRECRAAAVELLKASHQPERFSPSEFCRAGVKMLQTMLERMEPL